MASEIFSSSSSSLAFLNAPPLVATIGAGTLASFSLVEKIVKDNAASIPSWSLKAAVFLAYWINYVAVSVPGRLDGRQAEGGDAATQQRQGRSLVLPSGWAFSIWAPIFLGELVLVSLQLVDSSAVIATVPYVATNLFQSIWCASFRPKYKGPWVLVSSAALGSTAYALSKVHKLQVLGLPTAIASSTIASSWWRYLVYGLPISLHFGWVTAATLVNLNGSVAASMLPPRAVAWVGHVSVAAATAVGMAVSITRRAPVYAGVICWALTAVADGMKKKKNKQNLADSSSASSSSSETGGGLLWNIKLQQRLSQLGAFANAATAAAVTAMMIIGKQREHNNIAP